MGGGCQGGIGAEGRAAAVYAEGVGAGKENEEGLKEEEKGEHHGVAEENDAEA